MSGNGRLDDTMCHPRFIARLESLALGMKPASAKVHARKLGRPTFKASTK